MENTNRHVVVALHGWFGWSEGWGADFPEFLERAIAPDVTIRWIDYRGYGRRMGEEGDYTLDEIARDVLEQMDDVESFTVMGHSMGGSAALRIAALAPGRVKAIVGISPVGATPTPLDEAGEALFFGAAEDDAKRGGIIDFTTGNRHASTWVEQMVEASRKHSTVESFAGHLESWARADFASEVPSDIPTLVVVGRHDPALGEETIRQTWVPMIPDAQVVVLEESGHYPMFEQPVGLVDVLAPFLTSHA